MYSECERSQDKKIVMIGIRKGPQEGRCGTKEEMRKRVLPRKRIVTLGSSEFLCITDLPLFTSGSTLEASNLQMGNVSGSSITVWMPSQYIQFAATGNTHTSHIHSPHISLST